MPQLVSYDDLARVMDVQPKSIADLVAKGMPHEARNQYDVGRCLAWYIRYLHAQMNRSGITEEERNSGVNLRVERHRLMKICRDLHQPVPLHAKVDAAVPFFLGDAAAVHLRMEVADVPGEASAHVVLVARFVRHALCDQVGDGLGLHVHDAGEVVVRNQLWHRSIHPKTRCPIPHAFKKSLIWWGL